jgi:hypothetical protein
MKPIELHRIVFQSSNDIVSLNYLKKLYTRFNRDDEHTTYLFLNGGGHDKYKTKRTKIHGDDVKAVFLYFHDLNTPYSTNEHLNRFSVIEQLTRDFNEFYYINANDGPSTSTIKRWIQEDNQSRKKVEHRNINKCPIQQAAFMEEMGHVHKSIIFDTDGMSAAPKTMLQEYGRSKVGTRCYYPQFVISGRTFSVLATACCIGINYYKIFENKMIGHEEFVGYMEELGDYLPDGSYGIIDNAATHKHYLSLIALNTTFHGLYSFASPYSPELKPIEKVFALIRKHIQRNSAFAQLNPRQALVNAFEEYSVHGPSGHLCCNFFNTYERNYNFHMTV